MRKEITKLQEDLRKESRQYEDQIKKLTEKFEKENLSMMSKSKNSKQKVSKGELEQYMKGWAKEKELLEKQSSMLKVQLEEQRRMHEDLMQVIKTNEKSKNDAQKINQKLEEKLLKYRNYKVILDSAARIECVHCNEKIVPNAFTKHMKICPPQSEVYMLQKRLPPLKLDFQGMAVKTDAQNDYEYSEYEIVVEYRNRKYKIFKKINLFLTLYDNLEQHFPGLQLPPVPDLFNAYPDERSLLKEEGVYAYDYSESMVKLLQFFSQNPVIRESVFFKKFLEIDKQFPDEFSTARSKKNAFGIVKNRQTIGGIAQSHSHLDLMPDGFVDSAMSPKGTNRAVTSMMRHANTMHDMGSPNGGASADTDDDECIIGEREMREFQN